MAAQDRTRAVDPQVRKQTSLSRTRNDGIQAVHYIALLVSAAVAFGAAWKTQDWRYGEQIENIKYEQSEAARKMFESAQQEHDRQQAKKDEALNEANERAKQNALAAASASRTANSLRDQLATARSELSQATAEAARNYAATLSTVVADCSARLIEVAKAADQYASDLKTLEDAWPN